MSIHYITHCLELGSRGNEFDCSIVYEFTPGDPGVRYYPDGSGCPPIPPEIKVIGVKVKSVDVWIWANNGGVPCLVYPRLDRDWLENRGWATMVDEIAQRKFDEMSFDHESDFYLKLVDEAKLLTSPYKTINGCQTIRMLKRGNHKDS